MKTSLAHMPRTSCNTQFSTNYLTCNSGQLRSYLDGVSVRLSLYFLQNAQLELAVFLQDVLAEVSHDPKTDQGCAHVPIKIENLRRSWRLVKINATNKETSRENSNLDRHRNNSFFTQLPSSHYAAYFFQVT